MQTFLPLREFAETADVLDNKRLGKQRSETMIIFNTLSGVYALEGKKGWPHHPATKMWTGHTGALLEYGYTVCRTWVGKGFAGDVTLRWFDSRLNDFLRSERITYPHWLGDEAFHASHRSNLLRKEPEYYRQLWPNEPDDLPYVWPSMDPP